jgi:hypothetical protein
VSPEPKQKFIIDSLAPGAFKPLEVKEDVGIMAGNTRVLILQERGIDVNSLPRIDYVPWKMTELLEPPVP